MFVMFVAKSFPSKVHTGYIESGMKRLIPINVIFVDDSSGKFFDPQPALKCLFALLALTQWTSSGCILVISVLLGRASESHELNTMMTVAGIPLYLLFTSVSTRARGPISVLIVHCLFLLVAL